MYAYRNPLGEDATNIFVLHQKIQVSCELRERSLISKMMLCYTSTMWLIADVSHAMTLE